MIELGLEKLQEKNKTKLKRVGFRCLWDAILCLKKSGLNEKEAIDFFMAEVKKYDLTMPDKRKAIFEIVKELNDTDRQRD